MVRTAIQGQLNGQQVQVLCDSGVISRIGSFSRGELEGYELVDTGGRLLPGFIDIHIHGGGGADTMDASEEAYRQICQTHAKHGTTALLLTTMTESDAAIERVLQAYSSNLHTGGAEILGFHIEGPFISPKRPGAQPKQHIRRPDVESFRRWMALAEGRIKLITMAPEVDGALEFIDGARQLGVVVSAGHTDATYDQACIGYRRGVQSTTHLFNAMSGLNHREPGVVGAALDTEDAYVELIADTHHVDRAVMRIATRAKGTDKVMLITDAIRAVGMPEGVYDLGNQPVNFRDGVVRLNDGTLAGSALTLDQAVRNLLECHALSDCEVCAVTSGNQSRLLQLPHGKLEQGKPANIVAMDAGWGVTHTVVRGEVVYRS